LFGDVDVAASGHLTSCTKVLKVETRIIELPGGTALIVVLETLEGHLRGHSERHHHIPINTSDSRARGLVSGDPLVKTKLVYIITAASLAPCYFLV
jgi:hypothetical protein